MKRRFKPQSNTLDKYFQSPETPSTPSSVAPQPEVSDSKDEDDTMVIGAERKRIHGQITSDLDDENVETSESSKERSKKIKLMFASSDDDGDGSDDSDTELLRESDSLKRKHLTENNDHESELKALKLYQFLMAKSPSSSNPMDLCEEEPKNLSDSSDPNATPGTGWEHTHLPFLMEESIADINRLRPSHESYDETTLYVPPDFLSQQTPDMRQWWILKSSSYDSVLFFKVGNFYELYHMDAVIGVDNLALCYMKGTFAHAGFPESSYDHMASSLIEQGFKVARVEQTETPAMMDERCKAEKSSKFDKVVKREICQITTKATCIYGPQLQEAKRASACYMLAIAEQSLGVACRFGVCFIDTSIGVFHLSEFEDDEYYSRLLALMAQHPPELILTERGHLKIETQDMLKMTFKNVRKNELVPKSQFYEAQATLDHLMKGCYFLNQNENFEWPSILEDLVENGSPKKGCELILKSLGACIWYLKQSKIDIQVVSLKKFQMYVPNEIEDTTERNFMLLDSITMANLDLLGDHGTLQFKLDCCSTGFGKRLLQQWICRPLCSIKDIVLRQEAIKELMENSELCVNARRILKDLPDLERLNIKIHQFGNRFVAKDHPDSRAVFYESQIYSANKVRDLVNALKAFENCLYFSKIFSACKSHMLKDLTSVSPVGRFIDVTSTLEYFKKTFDLDEAATTFRIIPQDGVDDKYDQSLTDIADLEEKVAEYLRYLEMFFGCKITYGTGKNRYQIEIPEHHTYKVTNEFHLQGTRKGVHPLKRYSTPTSEKLQADMLKLEAKRDKALQDLNRRIFEKFSDRNAEWEQLIHCVGMLDVLCSLAEYARSSTHTMCFPTVHPFGEEIFIKINDGVHPCTNLVSYVPNSTNLGGENYPKVMILTGPNMGGKSTLMRQVALIAIMAQMGCPVPAKNCELTLVDRVFTRIGAHDDILQGSSTFKVELWEAAAILRHASKHSLVLIDELGRGTSTHDGNAIASAYISKLLEICCRTIFSTHYHSLVERFGNNKNVQLAHMACLCADEENTNSTNLTVTLLYQLQNGNSPYSYGFNVAQMAGLSKCITLNAYNVSQDFHKNALQKHRFQGIMCEEPNANVFNALLNLSDLRI